jgi:hypothetical protein
MYCTCGRLIEASGSGCDPGRRLVGRNAALSAYLGGAHLQRDTRFKGEAWQGKWNIFKHFAKKYKNYFFVIISTISI